MKEIRLFEAFDGNRFDTADACRAHESAHFGHQFVGLTIEQIQAALSRTDPELAEAFEEAGNRIAKLRRDSGELKRRSSKKADEPAAASAPGLPPHDPETGEVLAADGEQDWQALMGDAIRRFEACASQDELLSICDAEREGWYNDAPAAIRRQTEDEFERVRKTLPMSAPRPPRAVEPPVEPADPKLEKMLSDAREKAALGPGPLRFFLGRLPIAEYALIKPHVEELMARAEAQIA